MIYERKYRSNCVIRIKKLNGLIDRDLELSRKFTPASTVINCKLINMNVKNSQAAR